MRHATPARLDDIEPLLRDLRAVVGLRERARGVFYQGSNAFLHFHEDPTGMYADVRVTDTFERHRATDPAEQQALLALVMDAVERQRTC